VVVTVHRHEIRTFTNAPGVSLGFDLGYTRADQAANEATGGSSCSGSGEGRDNRTRGDNWSYSWNNQCANPDQPPKYSADCGTGAGAGCKAFWRFGVDLGCEIPGRAISVRQNRRDVAVAEPGGAERLEGAFKRSAIRVNAIRNHV
jgi:hypothetical protein